MTVRNRAARDKIRAAYSEHIGVWRSLVARTAGGREVAGSSPVTPTIIDIIFY